MRPIKTAQTDAILRGPGAEPLPVTACDPYCAMSYWDLSPEERIAVAEGALIELHVNTMLVSQHPPVELRVSTTPRELEPRPS